MDERNPEEVEQTERRRPRVVDKRVSTRMSGQEGGDVPTASETEPPPSTAQTPTESPAASTTRLPSESSTPSPPTTETPSPPQAVEGEEGEVWTPEREAQARQVAQQIAETPSLEWVINVAVTLANVAGTKLDLGAVEDARLAIDALAGLLEKVGPDLGDATAPLKQTLAQLQMGYAQLAAAPPKA